MRQTSWPPKRANSVDGSVYSVILRLSTEGDLGAKLGTVGTRADAAAKAVGGMESSARKAGDSFGDLSTKAADTLSLIATKAIDVGMSIAKWGSVAVAGLATYGVAKLNNELEQTSISLAAISQAQGFTKTFGEGFALAGDQLTKMKTDVKTLPGDLGQLSDIMKTIATPAAQARASMDQIRELAGKTMLTSAILGVPQEVAAREMAQLLAGRAGAHNILGTRLGLVGEEAKEFNKESPEKRLERINSEMAKYQGAADRFGTSFVANWTTLKDNIKYVLLAPATAPLFEHVKRTVSEINGYFDSHKEQINYVVHLVGDKLVGAWDRVTEIIKDFAPRVESFIGSIARMDPGDIINKFEHLAALLLSIKMTGAAIRIGTGLAQSAGIGGGSGGILADAMAAGGGLGAAPIGLALGVLGASAYAAAKGLEIIADESSHYHMKAADDAAMTGENLRRLGSSAEGVAEFFDHFGERVGSGWDRTMRELSGRAADFFNPYGSTNAPSHPLDTDKNPWSQWWEVAHTVPGLPQRQQDSDQAKWDELLRRDLKTRLPAVKVNADVIINVQSNQDPGRIAELVKFKMDKGLYEIASRHVPNYAGGR